MFTIDPYYDISRYNESLEAMKNNSISFNEFVLTRPPYNFYLDVSRNPIMMNYDELKEQTKKFIVRKVIGLQPNDENLLFRRNDSRNGNIGKYINNDALQEAEKSDFACFFNLKNHDEAIQISKDYPGKIWYFGRYMKNRLHVFLATHESLLLFIPQNYILVKKDPLNLKEFKETGRFECELNYKVFLKKDFLKKYSKTPYFENGFFYKPTVFNSDQIIF